MAAEVVHRGGADGAEGVDERAVRGPGGGPRGAVQQHVLQRQQPVGGVVGGGAQAVEGDEDPPLQRRQAQRQPDEAGVAVVLHTEAVQWKAPPYPPLPLSPSPFCPAHTTHPPSGAASAPGGETGTCSTGQPHGPRQPPSPAKRTPSSSYGPPSGTVPKTFF